MLSAGTCFSVLLFFLFFPLKSLIWLIKIKVVMDESKKAARAFVDQYFPIKESNPRSNDVLGDLFFPPNSKKKFSSKQGYDAQSLSAERTTTDGAITDKSQSTTLKENNGVEHHEVSEPCLMSSSIDYGCRDDYPYNPDNRYPGPLSYIEKNDSKDGSEYKNPENSGAEWWQGSLYY